MPKYLDQDGLTYLWGKLKAKFAALDSNGKVPTSQLPDGLPATIADGSVTEAKLATAVQTKLNKAPLVEDTTVTVSYSAGTVGSRGAAVAVADDTKTGYTLMGAYIYQHSNSSTFNATLMRNSSNEKITLTAYRATGNAASNISVTVRLVWLPN